MVYSKSVKPLFIYINILRYLLTVVLFIITVHNQENNIEYFLRVFIYKMLYYNLNISEIIIVDLDSTDNTLNILKTFSKDFDFIKVLT